ncbi:dynactin p62 family protein [Hirsutella rhossiliensis]|uniref:Dynactin subunit 4 n=1 Tax=Hirsutella rhossiliensis TaxID=111463 RepID=A0A9P8SLP5_9HYPO|nr:dynactin p62 family domain-containing protein [Hirsutella rhossiliensis]KAH0966020.1 dynactin p62 family domain-containing protein [Hirsutella rhossiliensis]
MARSTPYTYIQCPCSDQSAADHSDAPSPHGPTADEDERTFDPRAPRSSFSLYPLEYLLYCEDCQQIRCPRCVTEEIVTYYCPNCLFEVPSSNLRSEGNRCTRSCYQCPVCIAESQPSSTGGPFALFCQYCNWSSKETGIEFERSGGLYSQLAKMNNGGAPKVTIKEVKERRKEHPDEPPLPDDEVDRDLQFASLKAFYQEQLADARASLGGVPLPDGVGFSSPANLTRIMSLYTGRGHHGKTHKGPSDVVREALNTDEGLKLEQLDESNSIKKLTHGGWDATNSRRQRESQLEPMRSKRCPVCRHIISKPENKVTSTRFKIRLVAKSYMPTITIRPLNPTAAPVPVGSRPGPTEEAPLTPMKPYQYILTFKNPLFDNIKVTLATPSTTPGRFASKVTVLCPQFEVNANTDMWDDALKEDGREGGRKGEDGPSQGEAGKIWERGRNWVSIVLEVIPASLRAEHSMGLGKDGAADDPPRDDEDILEIPMFVRIEWEADAHNDMGTGADKDKETREKRELAYWCVLGVGRISHE